jgi:hypothetical protein
MIATGLREQPEGGVKMRSFGETMSGSPATQSVIRGQVYLFVSYLRSIQQK